MIAECKAQVTMKNDVMSPMSEHSQRLTSAHAGDAQSTVWTESNCTITANCLRKEFNIIWILFNPLILHAFCTATSNGTFLPYAVYRVLTISHRFELWMNPFSMTNLYRSLETACGLFAVNLLATVGDDTKMCHKSTKFFDVNRAVDLKKWKFSTPSETIR